MRKTLLITTALMLVFGCGSSEKEPEKEPEEEPINFITLIERNEVYYTKDTNKPYSGPVFGYGETKYEGTLKDGKFDGKWTTWHENGQKESEGNYKTGKKDGKWTWWYFSGSKRSEETYKDGELIRTTWWDEDGNEY